MAPPQSTLVGAASVAAAVGGVQKPTAAPLLCYVCCAACVVARAQLTAQRDANLLRNALKLNETS